MKHRGPRRLPSGWMENVPTGDEPTNKQDLLGECNTQGLAPRDFMSVFCLRCRNHGCSNAGWANSKWEARMMTQEERLLYKPSFADPEDPRFQPVREVDFPLILQEANRLESRRGNDDWDLMPEVQETLQVQPELPVIIVPVPKSEPTVQTPVPVPVPVPVPLPAHVPLPVTNPPTHSVENTDFPEEGVMLGGAPKPQPPSATSTSPRPTPIADPWAPKPKERVVAPGAKIKMGG